VIEAFAMNQGVPTVVTGTPFFTGTDPFGLAIDSTGSFLYTANKLDNSISEFTINADGSLSELSSSPIGETYTGPDALLIDQSGKYLYVANQGAGNLAAYSIGSDGGLTLLTTSPFATGSDPSFIATDPNGKYIFVGNQTNPSVQSFSLDASDGVLTSVQTYSVPGAPTSIALTP
jgi:6-phosphogluconolactonase (cycloisomerase 2 family)